MRRLLLIGGIILGVLVLAAVALPFFISVDHFRPELEQKLSAALNRQVRIGKLDASILSGGATASDISIADDPAFNKGPFLQASAVKVGVRLRPLIFSRRLEVTSLSVERPEIVLLRNAAGKWNYSTLGSGGSAPKSSSSPSSAAAVGDLSVETFEIVDGKVRVGQSGRSARRESIYQNVNLVAHNISASSAIPFTVKALTPGGGALRLEGQAGPLDRQDSARTPFEAQISLQHADLGTTGFLDPSSGLGGILDFGGKIGSDGRNLHSEGKASANNLKVVKGSSPAKMPVAVEYRSDLNLTDNRGTLNAAVHARESTATASGTLDAHGDDTVAHLKLQGKNMAVNDVEGLLPAFGVVLPSGASLQGGVINMDLAAEGPLDRLVVTGPLNISGTRLSGYNLGAKLGPLASFAGIRSTPDTEIKTVSSGLRLAPEGLRADSIVLDVPEIGTFTGQGVVGNDNSLDFQMLLKISNSAGTLLGNLGGFSKIAQTQGIPFQIRGKTTNPVFLPGLGSGAKGSPANAPGDQGNPLKGVLDNLLGGNKKKQQQ
ncbi:MAG TPA: AsmA family protein [Candidatus Angelobacter sp.]|nr:AsmA family protein [Candidatus Angelobacter sp.]